MGYKARHTNPRRRKIGPTFAALAQRLRMSHPAIVPGVSATSEPLSSAELEAFDAEYAAFIEAMKAKKAVKKKRRRKHVDDQSDETQWDDSDRLQVSEADA